LRNLDPHVNPQSLIESLSYFLTDDILDEVIKFKNMEANRINGTNNSLISNPLCQLELNAFIGILYLMGVLKGGYESIRDFWHQDSGQKPIIATMSRNRFMDIMKSLRFDKRLERNQFDHLAPIRSLWEMFLRNCRRCIVPSTFICVTISIRLILTPHVVKQGVGH
jgi:hypothetical protein